MKKIIIGLIGIFLVFFSSIIVNASVNSDWADSNNMAKYKQVDTELIFLNRKINQMRRLMSGNKII